MEHDVAVAREPEREPDHGPIELHIVKKYGKFHGHVKMADGGEHHAPPAASMGEAHMALAPHIGMEPVPDRQIGPEDAE
jgi:hypothetical protein